MKFFYPMAVAIFVFVQACAFAADTYPTRPVRLIVPYAPGGSSDITARAVGQKLAELLGQSFVIDSRPGAASIIGTEIAAHAPADGQTLIISDPAFTINFIAYAKPSYAIADFKPVSLLATTPHMLLAHPSFAHSLKELLAMPKAQTSKFAMGTTGQGPYMIYEWLRSKTGITFNEVPYKGGGPALIDAMANQIPLVFTPVAGGAPYLKSGRLKGVGITTAVRHPLVADVPTFRESGVPDFVVSHWFGILAPAGTPQNVVTKLNAAVRTALTAPEVRDRFTTLALDVTPSSEDEFRSLIDRELKRWKEVMTQTDVRIEQ
ncbi:MAG: LacI family transcriptional regulator [Betaproteobacteria bacterium]|nr:LacI family transcriptional regulator [Betaproteobacteria bacterium]